MKNKDKNQYDLTSKVILLTGAAGILGEKIAFAYAEQGAELILTDLNYNKLKSITKKINQNFDIDCKCIKANLTIEKDVIEVKNFIIKNYRKLDVLYSNAAGKTKNLNNFFDNYEDYSYKTWKEIMNVNLDSMFLVTKHIGSLLKDNLNGGSVILTSSIYGCIAPDQRIYKDSLYNGINISSPAVYSASKAGVIGLMKFLSSYWGKSNIRVNSISPGGFESGQNKKFINNYSKRVPLGKMADINDITGISVFLASDASNYFSGHNFVMDGGLSVW